MTYLKPFGIFRKLCPHGCKYFDFSIYSIGAPPTEHVVANKSSKANFETVANIQKKVVQYFGVCLSPAGNYDYCRFDVRATK